MTWSNVGDEPGRIKIPKGEKDPPKGRVLRVLGGLGQKPGHQNSEPPAERRERLRRIARGQR